MTDTMSTPRYGALVALDEEPQQDRDQPSRAGRVLPIGGLGRRRDGDRTSRIAFGVHLVLLDEAVARR